MTHVLSWNLMCCQVLKQNTVVRRVNSEMTDCCSAASSKSGKDLLEAEDGHQPPEVHDTHIFQLSAQGLRKMPLQSKERPRNQQLTQTEYFVSTRHSRN